MTLIEEINTKCTPAEIAEGNYHIIADKVSVGRTKFNKTEIGNGTILETIGLTAGAQLLDAIYSTPAFKYVIPLLEQGRLVIGSGVAQDALQSLVGFAITQADADKLKFLGIDNNPASWQQCYEAISAATGV